MYVCVNAHVDVASIGICARICICTLRVCLCAEVEALAATSGFGDLRRLCFGLTQAIDVLTKKPPKTFRNFILIMQPWTRCSIEQEAPAFTY